MEKGKGRLWFHVASVGEFNTAKPLLKRLYQNHHITLTYFSFRAKEYLYTQTERGYFHELYRLPPDLPFFVRRFERKIKPDVIFIMERELWPFLILSTKAPKVWINAYSRGGLMERLLLKGFSLIIAREKKDAERFLNYAKGKVVACGNLKFVLEEPPPVELKTKGERLLVAGSTHPGEELILREVYRKLRSHIQNLKLVIAPRHISRAGEVLKLFEGMKAVLKSQEAEDWDVLVVDTLGELFSIYRYAHVAFVGGTFVPVGGHNLLEPAYFGKPVLYGPYTHKVEDLRSFLEEVGLGFCVRNEEELYEKLYELLTEGVYSSGWNLKDHSQSVLNCYLEALGAFLEKVL